MSATVDILWNPISQSKITVKERRSLQLKLTEYFNGAQVQKEKHPIFMSNLPRVVFEDVPTQVDPEIANEMILLAMKVYGDASDVPHALESMVGRDSLAPYEPVERTVKAETRQVIKTTVERLNDVGEGTSPAPRKPIATTTKQVSNPLPIAVKNVEEEPIDDQEDQEDQDRPEATIGLMSFKNTAVLYEPSLWDSTKEGALDLERALRSEFLVMGKSSQWEFEMAEHAIHVTVEAWIGGLPPQVLSTLIDQFLLRLKLVQTGTPGAKVNVAMKKLAMNKLPRRYRNILSATGLNKDQFGQQVRDQPGDRRQFRGRSQSTSRRVPSELWKSLSEEQKALLKRK